MPGMRPRAFWAKWDSTMTRAHQVQLGLFPQKTARNGLERPLGSSQQLQEKWGTEPGQLWKVGPHFFYCGDATDQESWHILMKAAQAKVLKGIFTSPPYGTQRLERYGGIEPEDYVPWFMNGLEPQFHWWLDPTGSFFLNIQAATVDGRRLTYDKRLVTALEEKGWVFFEEYSWIKPGRPGKYQKRFKNAREPIYQFVSLPELLEDNIEEVFEERSAVVKASEKGLALTQGIAGSSRAPEDQFEIHVVRPSNVLKINHEHLEIAGNDHPARFPVKLPSFFIQAYSFPGEWWLDPFAGTFTTIRAAHLHGRHGLGIEIRPNYVAIGLEIFHQLMGVEGELINV